MKRTIINKSNKMASKVIGTDATTGLPVSLDNLDLEAGLTVEDIPRGLPWDLTIKDDSPATYVSPHVGGRPDDR